MRGWCPGHGACGQRTYATCGRAVVGVDLEHPVDELAHGHAQLVGQAVVEREGVLHLQGAHRGARAREAEALHGAWAWCVGVVHGVVRGEWCVRSGAWGVRGGAWHAHQCVEGFASKGRRPGEHLDERRAERPHVAPLTQPVAHLVRVRVRVGMRLELGFGL